MVRPQQPVVKGSIKNFFNGTVKAAKKFVKCPVCSEEVEFHKVNNHLDIGDCKQKSSNNVKRKLTDDFKDEPPEKKIKGSGVIEDVKDEEFDATDDCLLLDLCEETQNSSQNKSQTSSKEPSLLISQEQSQSSSQEQSQSSSQEQSQSSSQEQQSPSQIILSGSISYNPARYGGLDSITPPGSQVVRSHSFTRREEKYGFKTPTKAKRNRDPVPMPSFPSHDPYTPSKRHIPEYVPYYVTNFEYILGCVIDCTTDKELFTDCELDLIDSYRRLGLSARKLYVRLFNRRHAWIPVSSIRYEEIPNITETAEDLVGHQFLDDKEKLDDLSDLLKLLHSAEVKTLSKDFNCGSKSSTKTDLISQLLKMSTKKSGMSGFFQKESSTNTLESKMINKGKALAGSCYRLNPNSRSVLLRVLCLWGMSSWWESQEDGQAPSSLTAILLANQGKVTFPQYTIKRETKLFRNREDLIYFESAITLESRLEQALANKDFDEGYIVYLEMRDSYMKLDDSYCAHVVSLPFFLRRFSALAVLVVGISKSVDLLEKMKNHKEAVDLLHLLLSGDGSVLSRYRGHWYDRLSLDLETHLKQPRAALAVVETGLSDMFVKPARRLILVQRAVKICRMKRNKMEDDLERLEARSDWDNPLVEDLPARDVSGRMVNREGQGNMGKSVFQVSHGDGDIKFCNVEELVLDHYKDELGLTEGLHAEGAVFNSLVGLLFWDQIYLTDLPDVFREPGQSVPLDWDTDHFYLARKEVLDERLAQIRDMDIDQIVEEVRGMFELYQGVSSIVSWSYWPTCDRLVGLVRCIPPLSLTAVLERMITDHRATRSGLPDLTVWDCQTGKVRLVEVKGPGDKLSTKQILWVRFLNSVGIECEVCRVIPTGSKGIQRDKESTYSPKKKSPDKVKIKTPKKSPLKGNTSSNGALRKKGNASNGVPNKIKDGKKITKINCVSGEESDFEPISNKLPEQSPVKEENTSNGVTKNIKGVRKKGKVNFDNGGDDLDFEPPVKRSSKGKRKKESITNTKVKNSSVSLN